MSLVQIKMFIFLKNKKNNISRKLGFTIVEVLIASSIISVTTLALMSVASRSIEISNKALRQSQASMITEEGVEAVRIIRDSGWSNISNLSLNTNYYLTFSTNSNTWSLSTTPSAPIDDQFTRTITFYQVYRDSTTSDIVSSGTLDPGTKRVEVVTSWVSLGQTISKKITFYISDIFS